MVMGRFATGVQLAKLSWSVLKKDKGLLIFPVVSGLLTIIVAATFFLPMWLLGALNTSSNDYWLFIFPLFFFYLISYFVIIFFNSALVACVMYSFEGGKPSFRYGVAEARKRTRQVVAWAAVSATVGLVLHMISEKGGLIGQLAAGLAGVAWSIASYFVIPIIVMEGLGPWAALKRSAQLFKSTWGEAMISNIGIGLIFFGLALLGFIPLILGFLSGDVVIMVVLITLAFVYWVILGIISSALTIIIMSALYRYATTGKSSAGFGEGVLKEPFPVKHDSNWGKI
jgi:hypothetical protein